MPDLFEQLKQKYQPVLDSIKKEGAQLQNLNLEPTRPYTPTDVGRLSVKARSGLWQEAQATVPSTDKRGSKNSFSPREIF